MIRKTLIKVNIHLQMWIKMVKVRSGGWLQGRSLHLTILKNSLQQKQASNQIYSFNYLLYIQYLKFITPVFSFYSHGK